MSTLTLGPNKNTVCLEMNIVTINWEKADLVFGRLTHAVRTRSFPFNEVEVPQVKKNIPDSIVWGSYEHALFLFVVCRYFLFCLLKIIFHQCKLMTHIHHEQQ